MCKYNPINYVHEQDKKENYTEISILSIEWPCVIHTSFNIDSVNFNIRVTSVEFGARNTNDAGSSDKGY